MSRFSTVLKNIFVETFHFLISKVFLKNALFMIAATTGMLFLSTWGLNCYTNHGEYQSVHDFIGQTLPEVESQLSRSGIFNVQVIDSIYDPEKQALTIIDQVPKPDTKVKAGRTIYLTVNKKSIPTTILPIIYGKPLKMIKKLLAKKFIEIAKTEYKYDPNAPGTILEILSEDGTLLQGKGKIEELTLPRYSKVTLIVAQESDYSSSITVPKLLCKTYEEAKFIIESYNLNIGEEIKDGTVTDMNSSYIWRQNPQAGEVINLGEMVDLWLSQQQQNCDDTLLDEDEDDLNDATEGQTPDPELDSDLEEEDDDGSFFDDNSNNSDLDDNTDDPDLNEDFEDEYQDIEESPKKDERTNVSPSDDDDEQ